MLRLRDSFATLCRDGRTRLDISQGQLARTADISVAYVSLIELGRANPTLAVVDRISDALGLDLGLVPRPPVLVRGRQRDFVDARCSAYVQRRLIAAGLACEREVLIVDGRTHGWIDVMAFDRASGTLLVIELKTAIDDLGAVERQIAWYERNARAVAGRFGWSVRRVRSWLLVLASDDVDAAIRANREVLRTAFPGRARSMRLELASGSAPAPDAIGGKSPDPGGRVIHRGIALVDPSSRRREWLIPSRIDGRRRGAPYRDYADAAARLERG
jgi:transcriptional regulator with XRE-family HTH domain